MTIEKLFLAWNIVNLIIAFKIIKIRNEFRGKVWKNMERRRILTRSFIVRISLSNVI